MEFTFSPRTLMEEFDLQEFEQYFYPDSDKLWPIKEMYKHNFLCNLHWFR